MRTYDNLDYSHHLNARAYSLDAEDEPIVIGECSSEITSFHPTQRSFSMTTYLKMIFAAATVFAAAAGSAYAAPANDGLQQACQASDLTPHGYLDCR
jgi:hypothetical protein